MADLGLGLCLCLGLLGVYGGDGAVVAVPWVLENSEEKKNELFNVVDILFYYVVYIILMYWKLK